MLTHRGFSAWIEAGGKPLPEYLVAIDSTSNRVSCWVPSEEGKNFIVHWKDHGGRVDTCSFITLDGLVVPGRFLFGDGTTSRQGVRTSVSTERPFVFQTVNETVGQASSEGPPKDIGTIVLRIKRVARVDLKPANPIQELPTTLLGKRKAGEFCIGFGAEKGADEQFPSTWSVVAYDTDTSGLRQPTTFVSFVFRYRSREFLESQGIATELEPIYPLAPKKAPIRRVVSLPPSMPSLNITGPPRKKAKPAILPLLGPYPRFYQEERRTVSCKIELRKGDVLPGQGMLVLSNLKPETPWGDSGDSSTEAVYSQSSEAD